MSFYKSLLVASLVIAASTTSFAQSSALRTITAYGAAEIEVEPDLATLTLTVISKAPTAAAALAANAATSKEIIDALATQTKMEKGDYRNNISQSDDEVYDKDTQQRKVVGQIAQNTITVRTTNLDKLGSMIDLVTAKGGKSAYVSYGLINPQVAKEQALQKAAINASANAQASLSGFGMKVGELLEVVQSGAEAPIRRFEASAVRAASPAPGGGAPSTQVNSGLITVSASVTVVFAITK